MTHYYIVTNDENPQTETDVTLITNSLEEAEEFVSACGGYIWEITPIK